MSNNNITTKYLKYTIVRLLVPIIIIATFLCACGNKEEDPSTKRQSNESGKEADESSEIPKELYDLEDNIEKIIKILGGPSVEQQEDTSPEQKPQDNNSSSNETTKDDKGEESDTKKESTKNESENKTNKEEESKSKDKSDSGGDKGDSENQSDDTKSKDTSKKDSWSEISPIINGMHFTWNSYAPEASKKGASHEIINAFSSSLNGLTNSIVSKNVNFTLVSANNCYGDITKLFSIYKKQNISEVKKLKYHTRNVVLSSVSGDWNQANNNINDLKTIWSFVENSLGEENKKLASTLNFSIMELEKVVKEENQPLSNIKASITLFNIEEIDKKLKDSSKQEKK